MGVTMIQHDGQTFFLEHAPLSKHLGVSLKTKVWHLWTMKDYLGNFPAKHYALAYIVALSLEELQ